MTKFQRGRSALVCALSLLIFLPSQNLAVAGSTSSSGRSRGFVAVDPQPVRKQRMPASAPAPLLGEKIHPPFQSLEFGGRTYQYFEKRNANGGITGQTLIGTDRVEILTDREGDGVVDSWDIFNADGKMMFSHPYKGKFTFLQIEVMVSKGVMSYFYAWNKTKKMYALYKQKGRPYKPQPLSTDFIVGCRGDAAELQLEALAEKLDHALDSGSMESELSQGLLNDAIDPSCKNGDFAKYTNALLKGMMSVAKSDKKDWSNKDAAPKSQGQYLQCMRYYGLDVQASRIEAAFAQYTSLVPENRYLWKVACSATSDNALGKFSEPTSYTSAPTINMHLDSAKLQKAFGSGGLNEARIEKAYAFTFFHEMLHYSLMNETQAHTVGDCCGEANASPTTAACKELKELTEDTKVKQSYENYLNEVMPDKYSEFRDAIRQIWPSGDPDSYFESGLLNIAHEYNDLVSQDRCKKTATSENRLGACAKEFQSSMTAMIKEHYGPGKKGQCYTEAVKSLKTETAATEACTFIQEILLSVANEGTTTDKLKSMCPQIKRKTSSNEPMSGFWFSQIPWSAKAFADDAQMSSSELKTTFCGVASSLSPTDYTFNSKPADVQDAWLAPSAPAMPSDSKKANESLSSSPTNSKTTYPSSNPSHPIFANDSTTRTRAITTHLASTDTVITHFKSVAQKSFDTLIPRAQAETENWVKSHSGRVADGANDRDGFSVSKPARSFIPDPLTNFGANGAGGIAINDRRPAALPGGAAVSNSAGTAVVKSSVSPAESQAQIPSRAENSPRGANSKNEKDPQSPNDRRGDSGSPSLAQKGDEKEKGAGRAKRHLTPSEERALEALKTFLQNPNYAKVKKDLDRPSVEGALLDHGVQVVDDEGRVHGSGFPDYNFAYDSKLGRLAPADGSVRRPASKKTN